MRSVAAIASIIACVWLVLASCEDATPNLFVEYVIPATKECTHEVDSALYLPKGYYDAFCGKNYNITVRVVSLMLPRADSTRPRSEPNEVQFTSAEVRLATRQGSEVAPQFSAPVFSTVAPGDTAKPGRTLVQVEIIPQALVGRIRSHSDNEILTATIKLFGETVGGREVESDEFTFPFEVCDGCMTLDTANTDCSLSATQQTYIDGLTTCQNGRGYDGAYCYYCPATDEVL